MFKHGLRGVFVCIGAKIFICPFPYVSTQPCKPCKEELLLYFT